MIVKVLVQMDANGMVHLMMENVADLKRFVVKELGDLITANMLRVPLEEILAVVGHIPSVAERKPSEWPEFREYAQHKYPDELDEDLITMIEDLIERRREKRYNARKDS